MDIPNYQLFGENSEYIVADESLDVGEHYIIRFESKKLADSDEFSYQKEGEYLKFVYQKIDDEHSGRNTVDLSSLANSYKEGYSLEKNMFVINHKSTDYLVFFIGTDYESDDARYEWIPLVYNLDSGKVSKYTEEIAPIPTEREYFKQISFWQQSLLDPISKTTIYNTFKNKHQFVNFQINIYSNETERDSNLNTNLFNENFNLKRQLESGKNVFIYPRYGLVSAEQWFNDVLHWFSPVDGEPLTVHLIYENDGDKGYPIRSYADYLKATEDKTE